MSGRRSNTIYAVVERPDRHCGDDLVLACDRFVDIWRTTQQGNIAMIMYDIC